MTVAQQVIVRLLTDDNFRARIQTEGATVLRAYPLTADELAVLSQFTLDQWSTNSAWLPGGGSSVTIGVFRT